MPPPAARGLKETVHLNYKTAISDKITCWEGEVSFKE